MEFPKSSMVILILSSAFLYSQVVGADELWPEEAEDTCPLNHTVYSDVTNQLECQEKCVSIYDCVGICYSYNSYNTYYCLICYDDVYNDAINDFGFYRRPDYSSTTTITTPTTTTRTEPTTTEPRSTTNFATTERKTTTQRISTTAKQTSTTGAPYSCMDITVDKCSDEALDVIDTLPMDTAEDCHTLCDMVFKGTCNSYIYYTESKTCTILEDNFFYLYGCKTVSAGHDTLLSCLQDDDKYPDECKKMIESDCSFNGTVLLTEYGIVEPEECFQLSELMHGQYYVHEADTQTCKILDSNLRNCKIQRGVNDNKPSDCPK